MPRLVPHLLYLLLSTLLIVVAPVGFSEAASEEAPTSSEAAELDRARSRGRPSSRVLVNCARARPPVAPELACSPQQPTPRRGCPLSVESWRLQLRL